MLVEHAKGKLKLLIPHPVVSYATAPLPSTPSVAVQGEKAKNGPEISLAVPSVGLLTVEPPVLSQLWSLPP